MSVIIPVYNREDTIARAVNSVLQQTYKKIEVIIVDDCSNDSSVNIVKKYDDPRIKLICLPQNYGANYARNRGIENAEGELIAFQDSDDEWVKDKLDKQVKYMLHQNLEASFCPYILFDGKQSKIVPSDFENIDLYTTQLKEKLKRGNVVGTPTLVVRRDVFSRIGMFDEKMARLQDYEFMLRLVKKYQVGYIAEPLVKAYRVERSISNSEDAFLEAYKRLAEKHCDFIDLGSVIDSIFKYSAVFRDGEINWEKFDELIEAISGKATLGAGRNFYKLIIDYIYGRYFPVKKMLEDWYSFLVESIRTKEFAIYGTGVYGRRAYDEIKKQGRIPKCFLVTKQGEQFEIEGVPVVELSADFDKDTPVIIAVSWEKQKVLIENLQNTGIYRFCIYPFCQ